MKTIVVRLKIETVNYKYGPSSIKYMVGGIQLCFVKRNTYGSYFAKSKILDVFQVFKTQEEAETYCTSEIVPNFLKLLQS